MRLFLLNIFFAFSLLLQAQDKTIDSLKLAIKSAKHDTTRCKILSMLAETSPDGEWEKYNEQMNKIALINIKKINLENNSDNNSLLLKFYHCLAISLNNFGLVNNNQGKLDKASEYYLNGLKLFEVLKFSHDETNVKLGKIGIASSLNNLGALYEVQGNISKALECYNKSLVIRKEIGDKNGYAGTLNNISEIYLDQGDIKKALEYLGQSLKLREEDGDKNGIAQSLNNIGTIYDSQGDPLKATEFYMKSLKIKEEIGDKKGIANSLLNIGLNYGEMGDTLKGLEYCLKGLKIYREIKNESGIAQSLNRIGIIYFKAGLFSKALDYYYSGLSIREEMKDKKGLINSLNNISNVYIKLAETEINQTRKIKYYDNALSCLSRSIRLSEEIGFPSLLRSSANGLYKLYKRTNNYKLALEYYELYIQMRDSIANEETKKASIKSQLKYEYEKKAAADSVKAAEEKKVVDAQLKQEKTQRLALYGGLGLVGIFALFMVNRFRVTNKQKKLIEEQKKTVEAQKHLVEEKQKEILDSIKYARRIQTALITNEHYFKNNILRLKL